MRSSGDQVLVVLPVVHVAIRCSEVVKVCVHGRLRLNRYIASTNKYLINVHIKKLGRQFTCRNIFTVVAVQLSQLFRFIRND